jgi:transcriptional regulator GlxA family with amidase domain
MASAGSQSQQIARAIHWLKGNFTQPLRIEDLAKEKLGVEEGKYTLEEVYMKYFKEGQP